MEHLALSGDGFIGHLWHLAIEVRYTAKHPTALRTIPHHKELSDPSSANIAKPYLSMPVVPDTLIKQNWVKLSL